MWKTDQRSNMMLGGILIPLTAGFVYFLLLTVYNLFFHPLSKVPGPFLARASRLWTRLGNYNGRKSHRIHAAHQRYGPVVRIGPNEVSFADPAAVREIYNSDAFVKEETFYRAKRVFHEEMLMSFRKPEAHKQRRKLLARGFSQAAMLDFEPHLSSKIQTMLDQWAQSGRNGDSVDVYPWCLWLGFDTVYHLMFDEDPGSLKAGAPHEVMKYLRAWRPLFTYKEFVPVLEKYGVWLPRPVGTNFRLVEHWKKYATNLIRVLREKETKTPFLRAALSDNDQYLSRPLSDSELAEECMGGMFGGTGTTANTFVYLLWGVLRNSDIQAKVTTELYQAFPYSAQEVPGYTDCSKLPYLQACISETLRLYPTIIATLPRTTLRDMLILDTHVPKGTIVGTQNYTIHRDPAAYPEPETFKPERWLDEGGENGTKWQERRNTAFIPFSVGSRKCIGMNLSMMELSKAAAAFFLRFGRAQIDPQMAEEDMEMFDVFSASPRGGKLVLQLNSQGDG